MGAEVNTVQMGQLEGRAEARGLLLHVLDQFRTLDASGQPGKFSTRVVMEKLSAGFVAFKD